MPFWVSLKITGDNYLILHYLSYILGVTLLYQLWGVSYISTTMSNYLRTRFDAAYSAAGGYVDLYGPEGSVNMLSKAHKAITEFGEHQSIRILATNDSTFTETISNTYNRNFSILRRSIPHRE